MPRLHLAPLLLIFLAGCAGSSPIAQPWERMAGPYGQNVSSLLVDTDNQHRLLAGLASGQVFASSDLGRSWKPLSTIAPDAFIHRMLQDPENLKRFFAATGAGLYASDDEAATWKRLPLSPDPRAAYAVAVDPWNTSVIYAGLQGRGLMKSTDGGATWRRTAVHNADLEVGEVRDIKIDPSRPDRLYAAVTGAGILASTDAGESWRRLTASFSPTGSDPVAVVAESYPGRSVVYGTTAGTICKSTDGGTTWNTVRVAADGGSISSLSPLPQRPAHDHPAGLLAGTESGIIASTDFGSTWNALPGSAPAPGVSLAADSTGTGLRLFAFGPGFGLRRSSDGGYSWTRADAELGGATASLLRFDERNGALYAAVGPALLLYLPGTNAWKSVGAGLVGGPIRALAIDAESPATLLAATTLGSFKSTNAGNVWTPAGRGLRIVPSFLEAHPWIRNRMFASGDMGLFVSTDHGTSWSEARPPASRYRVTAMTFSPGNAAVIHAVTAGSGVLLTTDGGISWQPTRYGLTNGDLVSIGLDPASPSVCYGWTAAGAAYRSEDDGLEWHTTTSPWRRGDSVQIAVDRIQPGNLVCLVNNRDLYWSSSGGARWLHLPAGIPPARVVSLWWNAASATLFAGIHNQGIYKMALSPLLPGGAGD